MNKEERKELGVLGVKVDSIETRIENVESAVTNHLPTEIKKIQDGATRKFGFVFAMLGVAIGFLAGLISLVLRCL